MSLGVFVKRHRGIRLGHGRKQSLQGSNRVWLEQDIAADRADLGWHMVDHHHAALVAHGLDDGALLVVTRASLGNWGSGSKTLRSNFLSAVG